MDRFGAIGLAHHAAVKPFLAIDEHAEHNRAFGGLLFLDAGLRVESGVIAAENDRYGAVGVMAQSFGECVCSNLQRQSRHAGFMCRNVETKLAQAKAGSERNLGVVAQKFDGWSGGGYKRTEKHGG